jgi:hypothetical protein
VTTRLLAGALVLVCSGRFNAQPSTRPLSYAAIIGASDFDNAQIPRIPAAEASTRDLGKALEAAGIPARNIYSQIKGEANSHAVQTALRAVLKDRVTAADSVLVFIAGSGRIEAANGRREAYLLTQESNPGAKRTTAFQLSDLGMWVKDSPAAIYLIVDLTGDPIPELSDIAKSPRVLLSAVASASSPDLPLAKAAGDALTKGASGRSLNAGSLLESLRGVPAIQTTLAPQQVSAALFEPPQQIGPPPPTPRPGGVPTQATQPGGTQVRVDKPVSPSLENARAQYQKRNCREAKSILASANGSDPAVGELNALVDACLLKQTSLDQYRALPLLTASLADLQRALAAVQSALAKNPNDTELGQAATELQLRVQYASAVAQLQVYPEGTVKGIAGFIAAAKASPQPIQARLQPLITEAQKTSGVASVQSTLKQGPLRIERYRDCAASSLDDSGR